MTAAILLGLAVGTGVAVLLSGLLPQRPALATAPVAGTRFDSMPPLRRSSMAPEPMERRLLRRWFGRLRGSTRPQARRHCLGSARFSNAADGRPPARTLVSPAGFRYRPRQLSPDTGRLPRRSTPARASRWRQKSSGSLKSCWRSTDGIKIHLDTRYLLLKNL